MQHIHAREWAQAGSAVRVDCDHQCNVFVMDDFNYSQYQRGASFQYKGGFYKRLPAIITVPVNDNWNTVIDLGGGRANIRYSIKYISP